MRRRNHKYGKGECSRCGWIWKLNQLRYEWSGLKVCPDCWDPFPHQDFPRQLTAESEALVDPRPEHDLLVENGLLSAGNLPIAVAWYGIDMNIGGTDPEIMV